MVASAPASAFCIVSLMNEYYRIFTRMRRQIASCISSTVRVRPDAAHLTVCHGRRLFWTLYTSATCFWYEIFFSYWSSFFAPLVGSARRSARACEQHVDKVRERGEICVQRDKIAESTAERSAYEATDRFFVLRKTKYRDDILTSLNAPREARDLRPFASAVNPFDNDEFTLCHSADYASVVSKPLGWPEIRGTERAPCEPYKSTVSAAQRLRNEVDWVGSSWFRYQCPWSGPSLRLLSLPVRGRPH